MMRKAVLVVFLVSLVLVWVGNSEALEGEKLPELEAFTLDEEKVNTGDFLGEQYVLIDVWASWCSPCVVALNDYEDNLDKFEEKGIKLLAISVDDRLAQVENFISEHGISFTVLHDPEYRTGVFWGVRAIPTAFLINPEKQVIMHKEGYSQFEPFWDEVLEAIENDK